MVAMTIEIPDELARDLAGVAAAQQKSLEQLVVERLRSLPDRTDSPRHLLKVLQALPHPSPEAVDEMEAAIAAARLPIHEENLFGGRSRE